MFIRLVVVVVVTVVIGWFFYRYLVRQRVQFILNFTFPEAIKHKIITRYPHLSEDDVKLVGNALRKYFYICSLAGNRSVSMPSQVVDVAWHEFILYTRDYQQFCEKGFGRFLHHVPAEAMPSETQARAGIRRTWRWSCKLENINYLLPHKLPLLFAIDAQLNIPDGFYYAANCKPSVHSDNGAMPYCGGDIGCSSHLGGVDANDSFSDGMGGGCSSD